MSERRSFVLVHQEARRRALQAVADAPDGYGVTLAPPTRSVDQNAAQWPILEAFSRQLKWPVNGQMVQLTAEEWKDVLSAAFQNEAARIAMGLNGGMVILGMRTSQMSKRQFSDWLEFLHATAVARGVQVYPQGDDAHERSTQ
ncbi:MAG: recombination protein NinB [Mycobacterium sp.]|nr:recombination protein NinB [Mycobacterium sp.]